LHFLKIVLYFSGLLKYTDYMQYVIIGNGVAGVTAALNIRKFDDAGEIVVITDEDIPFYSRMRLPEYLSDSVTETKLILFNDTWYEGHNIRLATNRRVLSLDVIKKQVILDNRTSITYDKLLLATGGRASMPPLQGSDLAGVFTLRNVSDARKIKQYAKNIREAIILGGGVLGLEIGNALQKISKSVTIVEFFPRLLPRQMDDAGSLVFRMKLESLGLRFILNARAEEVLGRDSAAGLRLGDKTILSGQMLVISAGVTPNTSILADSGLTLNRGVPVNDRMETGLPDIYAAGDAAEHRNRNYGIWPAAEKQGEVAGINMAGGNALYEGTIPSNSITVAGIEVISFGDIDVDCTMPSLQYKNEESGIYRKLVVKDNCVAGCILCGDMSGRKEIMSAIREKQPISAVQQIADSLKLKWMPSQK